MASEIQKRFHSSFRFSKPAGLVAVLALLLLFSIGAQPVLAGKGGSSFLWQSYPTVDGTVTDSDFNGAGDWSMGTENMALAGFNAAGPGEHRVIYEFDVTNAPKVRGGQVILSLNYTGSRYDAIDPNMTLWIGAGNGSLDYSDFEAGKLVTSFNIFDTPQPPPNWYENHIDVTKEVVRLMNKGNNYILFTIHANPDDSIMQGAYFFSTVGTWSYSPDQFVPAQLTFVKERPKN